MNLDGDIRMLVDEKGVVYGSIEDIQLDIYNKIEQALESIEFQQDKKKVAVVRGTTEFVNSCLQSLLK